MSVNNCAVILAGGEGKRMNSPLPKVLCPVLGKPMLNYVIDACSEVTKDICVVVGFKGDMIIESLAGRCETAFQREQLGTAHAVMQAEDFIKNHSGGNVLVLCGDAPLMDSGTIKSALSLHNNENNSVTVITAELEDAAAYGRIVKEDGALKAIVEFKDATPEQAAIKEINSGAFWFKADDLLKLLSKIDNKNAQGEYYLTDTVKIAIESGLKVNSYVSKNPDVVMGANDPEQLEDLNNRARQHFC